MSLLYKLEYQDNFTNLEKGIANYILDHKDYIVDLKITDLAEITYISPSTISRFCKKIGEKSYNDFRIHFASSVIGDYKSKVDYNRPFLNDDTSQSVISKLGNVYEETIEITKSFLDIKTVDQIQSILSKKKVIDLYGVGTAYITALNFEQKMMSTPYFINLKHIPSDQNRQVMLSHKDTVAIIISYSGEEEEIKKSLTILSKKKEQLLLLLLLMIAI